MNASHQIRTPRRTLGSLAMLAATALAANTALAQVNSVNLQFNGSGTTVAATGFDGAYNFNSSGIALTAGTLVELTLPGDTFGGYEVDPDSAQNFFYSKMNVSDRTVLEAHVNAINLNSNFHGGGIWMGTDTDHYIRLGLIHNSFETPNANGVAVEALRENEDRWVGAANNFPNRPGFDIESRYLDAGAHGDAGGNVNGAVLRLVRDHNAVASYISFDNGTTFTRIGGDSYSFNALTTSANEPFVDNRTAADPNNTDKTSHTVEKDADTNQVSFKIGAYAVGGGSSQAAIQFDSLTAITGTPTWASSGGGEWTSDANWTAGLLAPTNIESTAVFGPSASARSITVASNITTTNVKFQNAAGDTISGTGQITFDWFYFPTHPGYYNTGPGTVSVTAGNNVISAPTQLAHMHNFDIASGTSLTLSNMVASPPPDTTLPAGTPQPNGDSGIRKLGLGTLKVNKLLTNNIDVQAGTLQVTSGAAPTVSRVLTLSIAGGTTPTAKFDLTSNALIIDYVTGNSPLTTVVAQLKSGYANGAANGNGILSSTAVANTNHAIGFAEASSLTTIPASFGTVDADSLLLRYTFKGDTDINGAVNFDDLLALAQNYNGTGKTWINGDSNYDGAVNFDDLLALAQNYNQGTISVTEASELSASFAADWALAQSLVPEPTALFGLGIAAMALTRRR